MIRWHTGMSRIGLHLLKPIPWDYGDNSHDEDENLNSIRQRHRGFLTINCGGRVYRVLKDLLASKRNTIFEKLVEGVKDVPSGCKLGLNHYFFDRNPDVFHLIIHFYKTGRLHVPQGFCSQTVKNELIFWRIRQVRIDPCCYVNYEKQLTEIKQTKLVTCAISDCDYEHNVVDMDVYDQFRHKLRMCFSFTEKKRAFAKNYAIVSVLATLLSVCQNGFMSEIFNRMSATAQPRQYAWKGNITLNELHSLTKPNSFFLGLDIFLTIFFIIDQVLRYVASRNRRFFFTSFLNLVDLFCNTVTLIAVLTFLIDSDIPNTMEFISYLARSLRILRLLRHCRSLMVIFYTVRLHYFDVTYILYIFLIITCLTGIAMFFVDYFGQQQDESPKVTTFSRGFYWAAITLSKVGYGRFSPTNIFSCFVAIFTAACSLLVTIMRYPVLTQSLYLYFQSSKLLVLERLAPKDRLFQRRKNIRIWQ